MGRRSLLLLALSCVVVCVHPVGVHAEGAEARPRRTSPARPRVRLVGSVAAFTLPRQRLAGWVRHSTQTVARYYGGFPGGPVAVELRPRFGGSVGSGHTYGGRRVVVGLGRNVGPDALADDWVLVHELLHTTFPRLARRHRWMREGLSTYLEPILRVRAGDLSERELWKRLASGIPHGLPRAGDRGLDRTPTWGRVYWGGTLYWLLADLGIRRATHGRRSIRDALVAIARQGGTGSVVWPMSRVLATADRATGTHVMSHLYRRMARAPHPVDVDALWRRLGVRPAPDASDITLDDRAPLARIRRAIARGR